MQMKVHKRTLLLTGRLTATVAGDDDEDWIGRAGERPPGICS